MVCFKTVLYPKPCCIQNWGWVGGGGGLLLMWAQNSSHNFLKWVLFENVENLNIQLCVRTGLWGISVCVSCFRTIQDIRYKIFYLSF